MLYKVEDVYKEYIIGSQQVRALSGVELEIDGGKFYSIIGPSGSGKSTLLHLLGLLDNPTKGKIRFDNVDVSSLSEDEKSDIRNKKIGFVFQQYHLIPVLNVYENIEIPNLEGSLLSKEKRNERINRLIREVGLERYKNHRP